MTDRGPGELPEDALLAAVEANGGKLVVPFLELLARFSIDAEADDAEHLLRRHLWAVGLELRLAYEEGRRVKDSVLVQKIGTPERATPSPRGWVPPPGAYDEAGRLDPTRLMAYAWRATTEVEARAAESLAREASPGFILRFGEAFPADDRLALWIIQLAMCFNDLMGLDRMESTFRQNAHDGLYLFRLRASHLFEGASLLNNWYERQPHVSAFVDRLPAAAQRDFATVRQMVRGDASISARLKEIRNHFFHYPGRDDRHLPGLQAAVARFAEQDGYFHYGDGTREHVRPAFADDVAVQLLRAGLDDDETERFIGRVEEAIGALQDFAFAAMIRYLTHVPRSSVRIARPGDEAMWDL